MMSSGSGIFDLGWFQAHLAFLHEQNHANVWTRKWDEVKNLSNSGTSFVNEPFSLF